MAIIRRGGVHRTHSQRPLDYGKYSGRDFSQRGENKIGMSERTKSIIAFFGILTGYILLVAWNVK